MSEIENDVFGTTQGGQYGVSRFDSQKIAEQKVINGQYIDGLHALDAQRAEMAKKGYQPLNPGDFKLGPLEFLVYNIQPENFRRLYRALLGQPIVMLPLIWILLHELTRTPLGWQKALGIYLGLWVLSIPAYFLGKKELPKAKYAFRSRVQRLLLVPLMFYGIYCGVSEMAFVRKNNCYLDASCVTNGIFIDMVRFDYFTVGVCAALLAVIAFMELKNLPKKG